MLETHLSLCSECTDDQNSILQKPIRPSCNCPCILQDIYDTTQFYTLFAHYHALTLKPHRRNVIKRCTHHVKYFHL